MERKIKHRSRRKTGNQGVTLSGVFEKDGNAKKLCVEAYNEALEGGKWYIHVSNSLECLSGGT